MKELFVMHTVGEVLNQQKIWFESQYTVGESGVRWIT